MEKKVDIKIVSTKDGSSTLYNSALDEHYHSIHGALQESEHVYIKSGLEYFLSKGGLNEESVHVLEVGFGTGLNAILTALFAEQKARHVHYTTLENFPLRWELLKRYNFKIKGKNELIKQIHSVTWEALQQINDYFDLIKHQIELERFMSSDETFHVIYFDAFAPNKQSDIWATENLSKIFKVLKTGGCLVTYCAKGDIRRRFQQVGFEVQRIEGPPGKREMLRCIKV